MVLKLESPTGRAVHVTDVERYILPGCDTLPSRCDNPLADIQAGDAVRYRSK